MNIKLDLSQAKTFFSIEEEVQMQKKVAQAFDTLIERRGLGSDFLGWLDLPINYDKEEYERIKLASQKIKKQADVLLVIGIGGSYLGAKAALDFLGEYFSKPKLEIIFVGQQLSGQYINQLIKHLKNKDFAINVISKSGTTTEPAVAFRILKKLLEDKYGIDEASNRIYATTDAKRGALKNISLNNNYEQFVIADNIGGRYSVLSAVGLLPLVCADINIDEIMDGARNAHQECHKKDYKTNIAMQYAAIRNILYNKDKTIEMMVNYEPALNSFSEWWKQLYGESEGKDNKGIFVSSASFSTDLHSLGQMIQDGQRNIFETVLWIENDINSLEIPTDKDNLDGLNFLANKTMHYINEQAFLGTLLAHVDGGVPNIIIKIPELSAYNLGQIIYFFEFACGLSAYILGVNPFNQPGVEAYKQNMFALLGKPGFEELQKKLHEELNKN